MMLMEKPIWFRAYMGTFSQTPLLFEMIEGKKGFRKKKKKIKIWNFSATFYQSIYLPFLIRTHKTKKFKFKKK